jgi:hypothetical protein
MNGIKEISTTSREHRKCLSPSANSVFLYGIYIVILGLAFLFIPNVVLQLMGMKTTSEVWIHILGWFGIWLGIYYIVAGRSEAKAFIVTTIYGRPTFFVFLGVLVMLKMIEPVILLIAGIDIVTAIWTGILLRSENSNTRLK